MAEGTYRAQVDGVAATVEIGPESLGVTTAERRLSLAWIDLDDVTLDGPRIVLGTVDGTVTMLSHLGVGFDAFVEDFVEIRARARRAALLQWTGDAPLAVFDARRDGDERVRVHLFPDGLTVEPLTGSPDMLPLSCIRSVERDGYRLTLRARGLPDVCVSHAGNRTDELLERLARARADLRDRTAAGYARLSPDLAALGAADGWAVDAAAAGAAWPALRTAVAGGHRGAELDLLADLAGGGLRLGVKYGPGDATLPFALVPVGGRVAVEATDADGRATFVFGTTDIERLNAVLLATSFRREAISLPAERLGRWTLAVRTLDVVRWARETFAARVVHDERWADNVRAALEG